MGLSNFPIYLLLFSCLSSVSVLSAAPRLRLTAATVGPVTAATGANAASQTVEAYNDGDGALSLSIASSASWVSGAAGASRPCSKRSGSCIPLQFTFSTGSLTAGIYTATATVSDPNAVDAPQTITITVQMGGGVPSNVDLYTAPSGTNDYTFYTNSQFSTLRSTTNDQRSWLTVSLDAAGSFQFVYPYRIHVDPVEGQGEGTYSGTVTTGGSTFAGDNKTIAVTMRVTSQPILSVVPDDRPVSTVDSRGIRVTLAQGTPAFVLRTLQLTNLGLGSLIVSSATASGGDWLSVATVLPAGVYPVLDASKLSPGTYNGSIAILTNAVNPNLTLPVVFNVVAKGAPAIRYQGVVDNAIFQAGDSVTRGDILAVIGDQLTVGADTLGKAPPLDTTIGGARVLVNGAAAPMYYATYGQLAFQMPYEIGNGSAQVVVERDGQRSNVVSVDVVDRAPRLLRIGIEDYGAIVNQDGSLPLPASTKVSGFTTHPAKRGDTLTIYAIGLGATTPSVGTGQAAPTSPLARTTVTPTVNFGGGPTAAKATPIFAGLTPTAAGLYQLIVTIPDDCPKGTVAVSVGFPDGLSNVVAIEVE